MFSDQSQWETVQYFDNKIICDLIEEKHKGIISILVHVTPSPSRTAFSSVGFVCDQASDCLPG